MKDMVNVYLKLIEAPKEKINYQIFNVGGKNQKIFEGKKGFVVAMSFTYVDFLAFACCQTDKGFSYVDTVLTK